MNARDIYGCTPLHFASMRGNELATQELLSCKGINIEVRPSKINSFSVPGVKYNVCGQLGCIRTNL